MTARTCPAARGAGPAALPQLLTRLAAFDWQAPWGGLHAARAARWQAAAQGGFATLLATMTAEAQAAGLLCGTGRALSFAAQADCPQDHAYEAHIAATGCVPTRANLHDFCNALTWFAFPLTKAALNAAQAAEIERLGIAPTRGGRRDALTLFDENAVLFAYAEPALEQALRGFDWPTLFLSRRAGWGAACETLVFGHALLEKLVAPYKACTAHAWTVGVPADYFTWERERRVAFLDRQVAAAVRTAPFTSRAFAPLPVLGIPGWCEANQAASFYDDAAVFRPGRRREAGAGPARDVLHCAPQSGPDSRGLRKKGEESPDSIGQGDG